MGRRNRRNGTGKRNRWRDAEDWESPPERPSRRNTGRRGRNRNTAPVEPPAIDVTSPPFSLLPAAPPEVTTCGRCQEWIGDEVGGRGECLHPGSGILRPWWDTPACPFFH